jgi:hypothetical protein
VAPKIGTFGDFASLDLAAIYEQRRSDLNVTIENLRGNVALRETTLMSARERGGGESRGSDDGLTAFARAVLERHPGQLTCHRRPAISDVETRGDRSKCQRV